MLVLAGSALIAYAMWRGRAAVRPDGDGDLWWSQVGRATALFLALTLLVWIAALVTPLPLWAAPPGTLIASLVAAAYAVTIARADDRAGESGDLTDDP